MAEVAKTLLELLHAVANSSQRVLDLVCGSDRMADTKEETNNYTRTPHMSACTTFWEIVISAIGCIARIVDHILAERNVAADSLTLTELQLFGTTATTGILGGCAVRPVDRLLSGTAPCPS